MKYLSIALITFFLVACNSSADESSAKQTSESPLTEQDPTLEAAYVSLLVAYNDSSKADVEVDSILWEKGMTVSQAMRSLSGAVPYKTKSYTRMGKLLIAVGGVNVTDDAFWYLCVNDTASTKGMEDRVLAKGDRVSWYFGETNPCVKKGMEF